MLNQNSSNENRERGLDYLDSKIGQFNKDPSVATIYVGNLTYECTEIDIKELFEEFGYVNYVKIIKDKETKKSIGIAFVQMAHGNQAKSAIKNLNESEYDGRNIKVSVAQEKEKGRVVAKVAKKRRKPYKAYISKAKRAEQIAQQSSSEVISK